MVFLERYHEAIVFTAGAISIYPECAPSFDNRGLNRLRTGLLEEGTTDIQATLKLDDKQPEVYRNLRIYFLLKKEWDETIVLFVKGKEMDQNTLDIDKYILEAKNRARWFNICCMVFIFLYKSSSPLQSYPLRIVS